MRGMYARVNDKVYARVDNGVWLWKDLGLGCDYAIVDDEDYDVVMKGDYARTRDGYRMNLRWIELLQGWLWKEVGFINRLLGGLNTPKVKTIEGMLIRECDLVRMESWSWSKEKKNENQKIDKKDKANPIWT